MSANSDTETELFSEDKAILRISASPHTRKILKPVSPAARGKRQPWLDYFITEDKVTQEWSRTGTRKLKDGSSVTTYKCALAGLKCDARIKKVVSSTNLCYFSNGKEHSNHPQPTTGDGDESGSDTPISKRRRKVREVPSDSDSDSDTSTNDSRAVKQGMSNMVKTYVKNKTKKRQRIEDDEEDEKAEAVIVDSDEEEGEIRTKRRKSEAPKEKKRESSDKREKKRKSAKIKLVVPMP